MSTGNGQAAVSKATRENSVMVRMAERFGMDRAKFEQTLLATVIPSKDTTAEQVAAFLLVADRHGLNPLTKEIYAFPSKGGGVVPIVGFDGWLRLMNEHPQADGLTFDDIRSDDGKLLAVTATVYRKDRAHPTKATEYLAECMRSTEPWRQWPHRMLRNKAAIQAIRMAFGFAGIYDPDEAERIVEVESRGSRVVEMTKTNLAQLADRIEARSEPLPVAAEPAAAPTNIDPATGEDLAYGKF